MILGVLVPPGGSLEEGAENDLKKLISCETKQMQPFQAKSLVWEVPGLRFCIIFANFLNVFFMLLSRRIFC